MQWFYLASGSIVFFTSVDLLQRVLAVDSKNPRAMAFLFNLFAALIALGIFLFRGNLTNLTYYTSKEAWLYVAIAALMYAVFERYRFKVAKQLDASYFATVLNVSVVVAFIGSVFLYKESLGSAKIIGSLLILFALILVSIGRKSKKHLTVKGLLLGIFISAVLGLGWMLDKKGALYFSADVYNILLWAIPVPLIYLPYIKTGNLISEFRLASWKIVLLAALNVIGYLMQLKALEIGEATKVIPIVQTTTLFTVLFGIILLRERENIGRKVFAAILALSGVYLLI